MLIIQPLNQSDKSKFPLSPRPTTSSPPSLVFLLPHTCHGDPSPGAGTRCSGSSLRALGGCLCFHRYTGVLASRCHIQGLQQRLQNCSQLKKKKSKICQLYGKNNLFFFLYFFYYTTSYSTAHFQTNPVCLTRSSRALWNENSRCCFKTAPNLQQSLPLEILNGYGKEISHQGLCKLKLWEWQKEVTTESIRTRPEAPAEEQDLGGDWLATSQLGTFIIAAKMTLGAWD